jgi:hypothetical protein
LLPNRQFPPISGVTFSSPRQAVFLSKQEKTLLGKHFPTIRQLLFPLGTPIALTKAGL